MAIATDPPGLPATIGRIERSIRERQLFRRTSARAALNAADGLLDQLEMLVVAGKHDVPASMLGSLASLERAASRVGIDHVSLEPTCGVLRLMDDVYELEARLLRRCH